MKFLIIGLILISSNAFSKNEQAMLVTLEEHQKWKKNSSDACRKANKLVGKRLKCNKIAYEKRRDMGLHRGTQQYIEIQFIKLSIEEIKNQIKEIESLIPKMPGPYDHLEVGQLNSDHLKDELFYAKKVLASKESDKKNNL